MKLPQMHTILLLLFMAETSYSLKCLHNYCTTASDGTGITCMVEGDGFPVDCDRESGNLKSACYEEPISIHSSQVRGRGCIALRDTFVYGDHACSNEYGHKVFGESPYACVCFEDFCNNRFNNTLPAKHRVINGAIVRKSDGGIIKHIRTNPK